MAKVNKFMFRGYDLRGIVDEDLNPEIVEHIGKAHGTYMKRKGITKALIGYDSRATSEEYKDALARGFSYAGVDTIDIGLCLVGTFYWAQHYLKCPGGGFVTASHNPKEYNGFKLAIDYSETLVGDSIQELRKMVETEDYDKAEVPGKIEKQDVNEAYAKDVVARLPLEKKFKIVVDPSCTTAGAIAPGFFEKAGCEVVKENCNLDPSFPVGPADPVELSVAKRLSKEVLAAGADIGFSYDADGDRIGIVYEKGQIIFNELLFFFFGF